MSQIDLFAEVEGLRSYQQDRNAVELPGPMESGGDDSARISALEQQVRRFQEFLEAQVAVEIPEGPGLDKSYEFAPGDDKPFVAGDGIRIIDTGRQVFIGLDNSYVAESLNESEDNVGGSGGGGGLPSGGDQYQVLRKASSADGDVEWADGYSTATDTPLLVLDGTAVWNADTHKIDFPVRSLTIQEGLITLAPLGSTVSITFAECDDVT